jgi:hypothetical protein
MDWLFEPVTAIQVIVYVALFHVTSHLVQDWLNRND